MSLDTNIRNLATRLSSEDKSLRTLINGNLPDLSGLTTTAKTNLVAAVNEVRATALSIVNDSAATNSTTAAYSASKVTALIAAMKAEILGGVGPAFDTLAEIVAQLQSDESVINTILTALGLRLRVDVNNQGLTGTQQANGRSNLDVWSKAEVGPVDTDYVALFNAGLS